MAFADTIRVLALGLIRDHDRLFVSEGIDRHKNQKFYRFLGGGVDFGEPSAVTLEREFQEELGASLKNITYLGCLENIFTYEGRKGHEIIQLYRCDFADDRFYQLEEVTFAEGERKKRALWLPLADFIMGDLILYPTGVFKYLT
ncbi:MAG: NUDIX hydrolase [Pseudanabaenaceae cyanobacterium SKYGB_i_bin29]|nr:NUDIX hydrolase [Pseudanabaenaceae cyanobacterium SKYG29]MDW8422198.1 NUDIX hydrolase [Pseudanabaenaceae cyanobacterium SKYGB_i_bin29]